MRGRLEVILASCPALALLVPLLIGIYCSGASPSYVIACFAIGIALVLLSYWAVHLGQARLSYLYHGAQYGMRLGCLLSLIALSMVYTELRGITPKLESTGLQTELIELGHQAGYTPQVERLVGAISLGYTERDEDTRAMRRAFAFSGAAHILAVSGYHLGLVVALLAGCIGYVRRFAWGAQLYTIVLLVSAWLFTALTGWGVPTIRAAMMLTLYLLARLLGRQTYLPQILALSATLQLLYDPTLIYSVGMWLSYIAVWSIYLYGQKFFGCIGEVQQPILRYLWGALTITFAAQVLTLPLCLYIFGYVSWSFIFTCLPLAVLASLLIPLGLVNYLLLYMGIALPEVSAVINFLGEGMLSVTRFGETLTPLVMELRLPLWGLIVLWALALLPLLRAGKPTTP